MNSAYIIGIIASFGTTYALTSTSSTGDVWLDLLYSLVSAIVYALLTLGIRIITTKMEKKGYITKKEKKEIEDNIKDIADDGKLNGSNKDGNKDNK